MKALDLAKVCGSEVLSRANVRRVYGIVSDETERLDFANVEFLSRSAADELCNVADRFPSLLFSNLRENVEEMLAIVRRGRKAGRNHIPRPAVSTTYYCNTMQDLRNALSQGL